MARFDTTGLDELIAEMDRHAALYGEAADAVLLAGAEGVKKAWRIAAEMHGLVDTGDMLESIGFPHKVLRASDIRYVDIYPQGRDRHGVRNAEKAFVLHYGTSRRPATRWVDDADRISEALAIPAMRAVWEQFLATGQVPDVTLTPNRPSGHDGRG